MWRTTDEIYINNLKYGVETVNAVFKCVDDNKNNNNNNKVPGIKKKMSCYSQSFRPFPKNLVQNFWAPAFRSNVNI